MIKQAAAEILGKGIEAIARDASKENSKIKSVFKVIIDHPVKVIASFIWSPVLIIRMAFNVENNVRKIIAIIGIVTSIFLAYAAATILGSLAGALFISSKIGILSGIGFLLGTTLSVYLSAFFSVIVLNSVSFIFLKINKKEVVDYLEEISK